MTTTTKNLRGTEIENGENYDNESNEGRGRKRERKINKQHVGHGGGCVHRKKRGKSE